jgi:two-component system alkaline phosphatase synthesis response regulator PhoP
MKKTQRPPKTPGEDIPEQANIVAGSNQRQPRLLLIEDHVSLAEVTAELLRLAGVDVWIAKSGTEALKMGRVVKPDIILCDMYLPDMSGLETGRALRANPDTRNAVFAIHTSMGASDIRMLEREVPAGEVDLFLPKPITEELIEKLLASLASKSKTATTGSI